MKDRLTREQWDLVVAGIEPTEMDLAIAPVLQDWYPVNRKGVTQLFGKVHGHPKHGTGHLLTGEVLRTAEDGTWMRTRSLFYRLGRRYVHRTVQEIAEEVLGPGPTIKVSDLPPPAVPPRDYFPELGPDGGLPPVEDDDTSPRP
ncbi:DUF6634 family protein [Microvirga sp. GCM10011540]|uniref:DUF6634 family protein n=1 Tax=Microvirga sp. GCM10011540 TaxID=3317338 RepID=UPI00360A8467